jgi:flagellar hook-length control protein FliK
MTTTSAPAPSGGSSQASGANNAARNNGGSSATSKPGQGSRAAIDFFANLLGQATEIDTALGKIGEATDGIDGLHQGRKKPKDSKLDSDELPASANPLADLIGWTPAATRPRSGKAAEVDTELAEAKVKAGAAGMAEAQDGIELTGMTKLAKPLEADASVLAGLKTGAQSQETSSALPPVTEGSTASDEVIIEIQGGPPGAAGRDGAAAAKGTAAWRSTATIGTSQSRDGTSSSGSNSQTSSTTALQIAQNTTVQRGMSTDNAMPNLRSTVALDNRFTESVAAGTSLSGPSIAGGNAQGFQGDSSAPGHRDASFAMAHTEGSDHTSTEEAFLLETPTAPEDELDPNEFLNPGQLRHANVRVGDGTDEAIDIRLSMEGDTVSVNFRTDNADVRAGLNQHAGASLSDLMQRSGLQLSDVSVGAQSQQGSGQSGQSGQPSQSGSSHGQAGTKRISGRGNGSEIDASTASRNGAGRAPQARRADGGPALDVFA